MERTIKRTILLALLTILVFGGNAQMFYGHNRNYQTVTSSLVAAYEFDNLIGDLIPDKKGTSNAIMYGATQVAGHVTDSAMYVDGFNDYAIFENNYNIADFDWCISMWVKCGVGSQVRFTGSANETVNYEWLDITTGESTGYVGMSYYDGYGSGNYDRATYYLYPSGLNQNNWFHLVINFISDVNTEPVFFVNGSEFPVTNIEGNISSIGGWDTDLYYGVRRFALTPYYYESSVDQILIYNRALSAAEIRTIYNYGSGTPYNELPLSLK